MFITDWKSDKYFLVARPCGLAKEGWLGRSALNNPHFEPDT